MSRQVSDAPLRPDEEFSASTTAARMLALRKKQPAVFLPWLGGLLLVGLIIVAVVTFSAWNWLNGIQKGVNVNSTSAPKVSTLNVQRSAIYADVNFTLTSLQYATSFSNDPIHVGQTTVRAIIQVKNATANTIDLEYYDIARLLVPRQLAIAPTNLAMPVAPAPGSVRSGWIDFPVAENTVLSTLTLQLGDAATNEMLVTIPAGGAYNANQYNDHLYHESMEIDYLFKGVGVPAYWLQYHLTSVDVRYSYNGIETSAGQQIYVLNFSVDNPNGVTVQPGYGYDYIRLIINGSNRPPFDNTLPYGFKANAHNVTGHVAFKAPAGLKSLALAFLIQSTAGQYNYPFSL